MIPVTDEAKKLMLYGSQVLTKATINGFPVDMGLVAKYKEMCKQDMLKALDDIHACDSYKVWESMYHDKTDVANRNQLICVLKKLGYSVSKTDKDELANIQLDLVDGFMRYQKFFKCQSTFLKALEEECVDGLIHPGYYLYNTSSYRSSSSNPNFQNLPIRDPEIAKYIRGCIVAPAGHHIVECDYSGIEVRIAACYHKDPTMISYLKSGHDMHKDVAAQCYLTDVSKVSKKMRYCAKSGFVFPAFYGSYWRGMAPALWKMIELFGLKNEDGIYVRDWLAECGINELGNLENPAPGTFARHIIDVENDFWGNRFKVYNEWKRKWYSDYVRTGEFTSLTGFWYHGEYSRNQVINLAVQGSASHCKLFAMVQLDKQITKMGLRTRLIGEIHDSILAIVPSNELPLWYDLCRFCMIEKLMRHYKWINVPIDVEMEASPEGGSWAEKKPYSR